MGQPGIATLGWQLPSLTTALYHPECAWQLPAHLGTRRATGRPGAAVPCSLTKVPSQREGRRVRNGPVGSLHLSKLPTSGQCDPLPEGAEDQLICRLHGNYFAGLSALPLWILIAIEAPLFGRALEPAGQRTRAGHCPGPWLSPCCHCLICFRLSERKELAKTVGGK